MSRSYLKKNATAQQRKETMKNGVNSTEECYQTVEDPLAKSRR